MTPRMIMMKMKNKGLHGVMFNAGPPISATAPIICPMLDQHEIKKV